MKRLSADDRRDLCTCDKLWAKVGARLIQRPVPRYLDQFGVRKLQKWAPGVVAYLSASICCPIPRRRLGQELSEGRRRC